VLLPKHLHSCSNYAAAGMLCRSEEQRLEISRALIDFQMETNEAKQEWANTKYAMLYQCFSMTLQHDRHGVQAAACTCMYLER